MRSMPAGNMFWPALVKSASHGILVALGTSDAGWHSSFLRPNEATYDVSKEFVCCCSSYKRSLEDLVGIYGTF